MTSGAADRANRLAAMGVDDHFAVGEEERFELVPRAPIDHVRIRALQHLDADVLQLSDVISHKSSDLWSFLTGTRACAASRGMDSPNPGRDRR